MFSSFVCDTVLSRGSHAGSGFFLIFPFTATYLCYKFFSAGPVMKAEGEGVRWWESLRSLALC